MWYNPEIDDPKRRHFSARAPMDRRAIRYIIRCDVCETLNDVTHGQAHAAGFVIPCAVCETLLPEREVRHAAHGRQNPLNIP
jgi:hypothetical protein